MTLLDWLGALAAVAAGSVLQGAVGFGANLVAVPLLVLIEPDLVPFPSLFGGLALNLLMVRRDGAQADRAGVLWLLAGRLPGTLAAIAVLAVVSGRTLDVVFGSLLVLAVAISTLPWRLPVRRGTMTGVGVASGFMATTVGIGGPPLALLYQHGRGITLRGTLAPVFTIGASTSLAALALAGHASWWHLRAGLILAPAAALGFACSAPLADRLDRGHTRTAVLVVSSLTALAVLIRAAW